MKAKESKIILLMSSYPPRQCGLATFSSDVVNSVKLIFGDSLPIEVCALQKEENQFEYGLDVHYALTVSSIDEYRILAEKINNRDDIGMVCIEHEFGLFEGDYGNYLLSFLLAINKPIATVFHTVLPGPNDKLKKIVKAIIDLSNKIVVLTKSSQEILIKDYDCQESKLRIIPHGTHMVLWDQKEKLKNEFNYSGKTVLSTFGLISDNKNIETVLYALPDIIAKHPEVIYLVIGKTHPEVLKKEGEKYRNMLMDTAKKLKIENNVFFINEFLELKQLLNYLILSDIYLFASKDPNQAVSGTFAYAMSCGCAIISTPIAHAVESLNSSIGILLHEFDKPEEFKSAILELVENKEKRLRMGRNGYAFTHETTWENIALKYAFLFAEVTESKEKLRFTFPPIKLDHIKELTTDYGILQFSNFSQPDLSAGYTLDDNARALINIVMYYDMSADPIALDLAEIYLNFIVEIQREDGRFDNYKDINRQLTKQNELVNLEDCNGRALWSLGFLLAHQKKLPIDLVQQAQKAWDKATVHIDAVTSPRAIAYTLKGLYYYYQANQEKGIKKNIAQLADKLLNHYHINSDEEWCWYEDYMTYANNVLPEAMLFSFLATGDLKYKNIALITFDFLLSHYFMKGELSVISNRGWFVKGVKKNTYGEQPIEVATTIITLHLFYEVTGNVKYRDQLNLAFSWFLGNNHLNQIIYNRVNGASYDGLEEKNVNINQGAESTLCFFKAQLIMNKYKDYDKYRHLDTSNVLQFEL
ncbi:glycosyltransferase involved in cell wall biosynthesis [Flavobacterium sp. 103]|uniref:glycosyltransferase n=1 Tax=Flavobacterium sp. 103 TaxID=2135624 RepID=UPI000D5FCD6D|nr:glycosyltransferase [Flavobacterium sp. 103]PVX45295.1 glycosyltransferase involved in cell wall biosynthesis [Flavobacterium sp. 103]